MFKKIAQAVKKSTDYGILGKVTVVGGRAFKNRTQLEAVRQSVTPSQYELARKISRVSIYSMYELLVMGGGRIEKLAEDYNVH